jgi:integrase
MSLTDKAIRDAKPKNSVYRIRDGNVVCRGFGVTVAPSGAKTFFLSYTSPEDGKRKQVSLGAFPSVSLREARLKAAETRKTVEEGADPIAAKRDGIARRMAQRELGTLGDLLDLYASDLEMDGKRTAKEVRRITIKDVPPALLSRPAHLISRDDILDILTPIAQRGKLIHSDNVRAYLRAAFELGLHAPSMTRWRGRTKDFQITFNPVATVRKSVSRKPRGQRNLSPDEIRSLWQTDRLTRPMHLALLFILATGQRVEEALEASWSEFDLTQKLWTIPGERRKNRNKTTEPHLVPLTYLHVALLKAIKAETGHDTYLFPSRTGEGPRRYDSLNHAVRRFIEASDMTSFSPRDLRRTFKTVAGSFGLSLEIRNRLQGHGMTDVGSVHYDRYDYLVEKRAAMLAWTWSLRRLLKGKKR